MFPCLDLILAYNFNWVRLHIHDYIPIQMIETWFIAKVYSSIFVHIRIKLYPFRFIFLGCPSICMCSTLCVFLFAYVTGIGSAMLTHVTCTSLWSGFYFYDSLWLPTSGSYTAREIPTIGNELCCFKVFQTPSRSFQITRRFPSLVWHCISSLQPTYRVTMHSTFQPLCKYSVSNLCSDVHSFTNLCLSPFWI